MAEPISGSSVSQMKPLDIDKEWQSAAKGLNFTKLAKSLEKYPVGVLHTPEDMIKAVQTLSQQDVPLPSITELTGDASALNSTTATAAKIMIAAQLLRSNPELTKNPDSIKYLILGGRWMLERGEFLKYAGWPGAPPPVTSNKLTWGKIAIAAAFATISVVGIVTLPIIGGIAIGYGIYRRWQKREVEKWTEGPGVPKEIKDLAKSIMEDLKKVPYDWREWIDVDFTKKQPYNLMYARLETMCNAYSTERVRQAAENIYKGLDPLKEQMNNSSGIARFLSPEKIKKSQTIIQNNLEICDALNHSSLEKSLKEVLQTPDQYLTAIQKEQERLRKVAQVRQQALGDRYTRRYTEQAALLHSAENSIKNLKLQNVQPLDFDISPEALKERLKQRDPSSLFKTAQKIAEQMNMEKSRETLLKKKLSLVHEKLLTELSPQKGEVRSQDRL